MANSKDGIKIRSVSNEPAQIGILRMLGKKRMLESNGKDLCCERFDDRDNDRCYTFRIRTRRNDKGELVEAYYGKIYGDFEFEGDDKKGLIGKLVSCVDCEVTVLTKRGYGGRDG